MVLTNATQLRYSEAMEKEALLQIIRSHQLRLTKTRQGLLDLFLVMHTPLSVSHILSELASRGLLVNKTTVYRELEQLEKVGIVRGLSLGDRKQYFELASRDHHHHFVCIECDEVEDVLFDEFDLSKQETLLAQKKGFSVFNHSLEFFGLCKSCS